MRRDRTWRRAGGRTAGLGVLLWASACSGDVPAYQLEVVSTLPHDSAAYTQGLVYDQGRFYESTGRYGESDVRVVDRETGRIDGIESLSDEYFGEGLAKVGDRLVQLTWKEGLAFVYDAETLERTDSLHYEGEGWGLCYDGESLFMSDGSSRIQRRNPETFEVTGDIAVTRNGFSVSDLNELECVGDHIWANVYLTDKIVRIEKATGAVVGELDAYGLTVASGRPGDVGAVLNGIAYDDESETFYLTGKLWPVLFQVRIAD